MAGRRRYVFSLYLTVEDAKKLAITARERAISEGVSGKDWIRTRKGTASDLVMLLDPGSLPGCAILGSSAESE